LIHDLKIGDVVMVVRPAMCCGNESSLGVVRKVAKIGSDIPHLRCQFCNALVPNDGGFVLLNNGKLSHHTRLLRLAPINNTLKEK
jgi:hypothetical protein